jgi:hypothetical protein
VFARFLGGISFGGRCIRGIDFLRVGGISWRFHFKKGCLECTYVTYHSVKVGRVTH